MHPRSRLDYGYDYPPLYPTARPSGAEPRRALDHDENAAVNLYGVVRVGVWRSDPGDSPGTTTRYHWACRECHACLPDCKCTREQCQCGDAPRAAMIRDAIDRAWELNGERIDARGGQ